MRSGSDADTRVSGVRGLPMNVCVVMPTHGIGGGVERVALRLVAGLNRERYSPHLRVFAADQLGFAGPADVPIRVLNTTSLRRHIPDLAQEWRRRPPDIVVAHTSGASIVALLARRLAHRRFPVVAVVHIPVSIEHARKRDLIMRLAFKFILPWADAVVAVSAGAGNDLAEFLGWPRERIRILPNVVIDDTVARDAAEPIEHRWFQPGLRIVLGVGWLNEQKAFSTLINAFSRLVPEDRSLRLLILGDGHERPNLERLVEELDLSHVIEMPGSVPNPFPYMARSAVFVLSSAWEALPTVLIEALALGLPVVSTDCVAGPREILLDGRLGPLVAVGDDKALSARIREMLDHPSDAAKLQDRARDFGQPAIAGYEALMDELVDRRRLSRVAARWKRSLDTDGKSPLNEPSHDR